MEQKVSNRRYIMLSKELYDIEKLIQAIKDSGWVDNNTLFVNCFPEYSSILTQIVNHRLSYINNNELFEVVNLGMPYTKMSQVWDPEDRNYKLYIKYLSDWVRKNINKNYKYLFLGSIMNNSNYARLRSMLKGRLEPDAYRIAIPYINKDINYTNPDFFVESYEGDLVFEWENMNNPDR